MVKVHTDDNVADIMTKATGTGTFCRHVDFLMSRPAAAAVEPSAAATAARAAVVADKLAAAPAGKVLRRRKRA
jgi:hypothetical protein